MASTISSKMGKCPSASLFCGWAEGDAFFRSKILLFTDGQWSFPFYLCFSNIFCLFRFPYLLVKSRQ